jgi:methylmalonyl-CoA mutase
MRELRTAPRTEAAPRVVTATALYDGHDASINLVRRLLVGAGAEVIHLGHDRSAGQIAKAVVEEDAAAVCVSSYQGGHMEFFPYLRRLLDEAGAEDVAIFGGGGGVIIPEEAAELERSGVDKVFTPEDGRVLGLEGMAARILLGARTRERRLPRGACETLRLARALSDLERAGGERDGLSERSPECVVVGITGTGGAGKSSLCDELLLRLGRDFPACRVAVLAVDPTKRLTGGSLLGDRLRMNAVYRPEVFFRSFATRGSGRELAPAIESVVAFLSQAGFPLVFIETSGIGQGSSAVLDVADLSIYVMTADFGGPTQLEKIDMLDFADLVAVNKADHRGGTDALREVRKQVRRGKRQPEPAVVATTASRFNDPGVNDLYAELLTRLDARLADVGAEPRWRAGGSVSVSRSLISVIPPARQSYLSEAAETVRRYRARTREEVQAVHRMECLEEASRALGESGAAGGKGSGRDELHDLVERQREKTASLLAELDAWEETRRRYEGRTMSYRVREREHRVELRRRMLSGLELPRVALPPFKSRAEILRFLREESLPGCFPFTAGVFPFKRDDEMPTRQFAGEGTPARTNRRFHLLCQGQAAKRLSVAFDSVTLYGADPDERPDIYGKIGTSGVSIATLDDMRKLFAGFDLLDPAVSVSMTINGPAPIILAMFFNAAMDQQAERFRHETGRAPNAEESARIHAAVLERIRGTVQADILKEDQAQNTCIFSTEFALRMMSDVQEHFIRNRVRNYYSISISGYHIAEAGANPITQLAFTLANGLTYLEFYRSRGMKVDDFAPSFSFFFSNGLDAAYSVLGRVARRIWAVVLRDLYGAGERSQKLKYHIQTSGRSLHAQEIAFNDIRTTLQALLAVYDHCDSLHTNAYDEAITTPTEESVRRALAIQLIIQKELGLAQSENPLQGSFVIGALTDLVEDMVLEEFERISERGGIPGAMEAGYLRSRIQEESFAYEELKQSGELPIVGVNTYLDPAGKSAGLSRTPVVRSSDEEKREQIRSLREFQARNTAAAGQALAELRSAALGGENLFSRLMECVRYASLGQISAALFAVGGEYRRSL